MVWAPRDRRPPGNLKCNAAVLDDVEPPEFFRQLGRQCTLVAHNAFRFDAPVWHRFIGEAEWYDTLYPARVAGLPGKLNDISMALAGRGKKDAAAMRLLSRATVRGGAVVYPVGTPPLWESLVAYNIDDVELLEHVYNRTRGFVEPDVVAAHLNINARGILVDQEYLRALADMWTDLEAQAGIDVHRLTKGELDGSALRSVPRMKAWLEKHGVRLASLDRKSLEAMYDDPERFFEGADDTELIAAVLKIRQLATRTSKAKIKRIFELIGAGGRVYDCIVYYGAHTGRFSGRGFQPHNFPRGVKGLDVERCVADPRIETVREEAAKVKASADDTLATLLRPVIVPPPDELLGIIDYASIEARGVAWIAREDSLIQQFASGEDVYCTMAARIFGRPITKRDVRERFIGKETVLGSGYGMSAHKFTVQCNARGIDLEAAGTTAEACIDAFRDAYPAIAGRRTGPRGGRTGGLWKDLSEALNLVVRRRIPNMTRGRCEFRMDGNDLDVKLPSGRSMRYRNARIEDVVPGYCAMLGLPPMPKPTVVYDHPHGYSRALYGALMTENIVQALCRDILVDALVQLERAGYRTVLHVHDEIVYEGATDENMERACCIMSRGPLWAAGFPIGVEGFCSPRYVKAPFKGYRVFAALGGKLV